MRNVKTVKIYGTIHVHSLHLHEAPHVISVEGEERALVTVPLTGIQVREVHDGTDHSLIASKLHIHLLTIVGKHFISLSLFPALSQAV